MCGTTWPDILFPVIHTKCLSVVRLRPWLSLPFPMVYMSQEAHGYKYPLAASIATPKASTTLYASTASVLHDSIPHAVPKYQEMVNMGHWTRDMVSVRLANPVDDFTILHACWNMEYEG